MSKGTEIVKLLRHRLFDRDRRGGTQRLQHDAVPLRQPYQRGALLLRCVRVELEAQPDVLEPDLRILRYAECAANIEIAFSDDLRVAQLDPDRRRDGSERYPCACYERLEQHIP